MSGYTREEMAADSLRFDAVGVTRGVPGGRVIVATFHHSNERRRDGEPEANARLFMAAGDLLVQAEGVLALYGESSGFWHEMDETEREQWEDLKAAVDKAKGEA